jgi:hypothetical protein
MKTTAKRSRPPRRTLSVKGDIARAMFARWEKDHTDPRPMTWEKFQAKLEETRLRDTPLFTK